MSKTTKVVSIDAGQHRAHVLARRNALVVDHLHIVTAIAIPRELSWLPHSWSFYEINIITNIIMAAAMTWAIIPGTSLLLRRWLYGSQDRTPAPVPARPNLPDHHTATRA